MAPNIISICTNLPVFLALSNLTFNTTTIYSTPAHLAVAQATLGFKLYNGATMSTWNCVGYGYDLWDWFRGESQFNCTPAAAQPGLPAWPDQTYSASGPMGPMNSSVSFRYVGAPETVSMNATWSCFDMKTHKS